MIIENTELEYDETESKVLDYFLGGNGESKELWAQRVWDCCQRQAQGEDLARVYKAAPGQSWQERAQELWANKKQKRKEAIKMELKVSEEALSNVDKHPSYKTRAQKDAESL